MSIVSESSKKTETVDVVDNVFEGVKILDSVKTGDLMKHDKHCKLHTCCNSCTYCGFARASTKERSNSGSNKIRRKPVNHASFVSQLCCVPSVENVHKCELQRYQPNSSVHSQNGYNLPFKGPYSQKWICKPPQDQLPEVGVAFPL